ncbi:glycosyltransferase family 4 protein [Pokkaliibacter sp. MBI-7]|uniref:glycosyltransferase family 4 protein n=1 Tax=Pokkaliibacter sp. MBI-7 TaxID=3040600 RepID=UPI00244C81C3|nr:glycosyltransferase family 4 protein [Pokkaliibacter sp. MBI-7]MDH2432982.1 glycosyltransferase family 4 protein [Pokkaliibacter sp. MBI-7]
MNLPTIIHLISSSEFYGAERMLLDHCLTTPGQHRVVLIQGPDALRQRFTAAGVDCSSCANFASWRQLLQQMPDTPCIINAHNFKAQVWAWLSGLLDRQPVIFTQHGFTPRSRKQRLYTWASLQMCKFPWIKRAVCVADSVARIHTAHRVQPQKLTVIPNGMHAPDQPPATRRRLGPTSLIGFVGRLSGEKGPDLFLDALIPLCQTYPQLRAVMLGEGPEQSHLEERIKAQQLQAQVTLPGYQQDMVSWLQRLDILVISSRTEGTPMILLEAMAAGVPVVSFAVGGIPDVLDDGHSGLLAPALDTQTLQQHLTTLLERPELGPHLAQSAFTVLKQRYDLPELVKQWSAVYQSLCGSQAK